MNKTSWDGEAARYLSLQPDDRWRWLANLLFALTTLARGTYGASGVGVAEPEQLLRFNELIRRTAMQLRDRANGTNGMPDDVFAKLVGEETAALGIRAEELGKLLR